MFEAANREEFRRPAAIRHLKQSHSMRSWRNGGLQSTRLRILGGRRFESFRALRKLRRENPTEAYVFVVVEARQGRRDAVCSPPAHAAPRLQLLANDGHDTRALQHYLGHKNIQHTVLLHRAFP